MIGDGLTVTPLGGQVGISAMTTGLTSAIGNFSDTLVNTGGSGGVTGAQADGAGAVLSFDDNSLLTQSNGGGNTVLKAINGGTVNLNQSVISIEGGGGNQSVLALSGGTVNLTNSSVEVFGGGGNGMRADTEGGPIGGHINLIDTTVDVTGFGGNFGLQVNGASSTASLIGSSITVGGGGGGNIGIQAMQGGTATLTDTMIDAGGTGGDTGLLADGALSSITATDSQIIVHDNDSGAKIQNGGEITMTGGSIETQGTGGQAIFLAGSGTNLGAFIGTAITSDNGTGILAQGSMNADA